MQKKKKTLAAAILIQKSSLCTAISTQRYRSQEVKFRSGSRSELFLSSFTCASNFMVVNFELLFYFQAFLWVFSDRASNFFFFQLYSMEFIIQHGTNYVKCNIFVKMKQMIPMITHHLCESFEVLCSSFYLDFYHLLYGFVHK